MPEPRDLLERLADGDEKAMREVYQECGRNFLKWAARRFDRLTADDRLDAWHDTFYTFLLNLAQGKLKTLTAHICSSLTDIGKHVLLKRTLQDRPIEPLSDNLAEAVVAGPSHEEAEELTQVRLRLFEEAVNALSPQKRRIVRLRMIDGKTPSEIRAILGYDSDNSVSVTLSRAMQEIRTFIDNRANGRGA
jgi:RNA polymerase sigma factor (sigma-70 family)